VVEFRRFFDNRGYFNELYNRERDGAERFWHQVSFSSSKKDVVRGLHCSPYGKFITCTRGAFYDVIADFRPDSPTFGRWCRVLLTDENRRQVYVPAGCGHGFATLRDDTHALYLQEGSFEPTRERDVNPFDTFLGIVWPGNSLVGHRVGEPVVSEKDKAAPTLRERLSDIILPRAARGRVLVIGASGQVGSAIVEHLGYDNCIETYCSTPTPRSFVKYDMTDSENLETLTELLFDSVKPTHVFVCCGFTKVDACESANENVLLNHQGPLVVSRAAARHGTKFVWFSTDYVFDGSAGPYGEDDEPCPLNVYGTTKLETEIEILKQNRDALIVRTNGVYGPEEAGKNFVYQVLEGRVGRVPRDQYGTPVYSRDLAKACAKLIDVEARGIFHVSGSEFLNRKQFADKIIDAFELPHDVTGVDTSALNQGALRPLRAGLRNDKVQKTISDWRPRSIVDALAHWKANNRGKFVSSKS
jgi:dTDP-4-dehydrorhamnose reductase/dTDP-4-dehydrorhamnose 3,5-epimerase